MSLFDYLRPSRRRARREAREQEAQTQEYEARGTAIINNFYNELEQLSYEAQNVRGHESPGASAFSGIAPDCIDEIEIWRNSVGDGITGAALERVEAEMRGNLENLRNYYNTSEAESNDLQQRTLDTFAGFMEEIIKELTDTTPDEPEPEPEPEPGPEGPTGGGFWHRIFNFFTGR